MIDVIIPTMWFVNGFDTALETYTSHPKVSKVIIIDNNKSGRPKHEVLKHPKIELVSYGRNIYVNPAWNEGVARSTSDIVAIINDDITVEASVFDMVEDFGLKPGDLIGVNLRGRQNNYKIDAVIETPERIVKLNYNKKQPIGGQAWAFGICMFMLRESYVNIPSLYQVWYGDDYLTQHAAHVYAIESNKIKGKISETLVKFNNPDDSVSKRIELDSMNLLKFNHFTCGDNWDIPRNMIAKYKNERQMYKDNNVFLVEYELARKTPSDINENLHILHEIAKECTTVVEMGVRTGVSTRAFLATNVELTSYDIQLDARVQQLFDVAKLTGKKVKYIKANVLDIEITPVDMIFIDTLHTYEQLKAELKLHASKAKKYLAFHDTHTFGLRDEIGHGKQGLMTAIIEFMAKNSEWVFHKHVTNNNGLTILKRV